MAEEDYRNLLQDIKDLSKVLKRRSEKGMEARSFFKMIEGMKRTGKRLKPF